MAGKKERDLKIINLAVAGPGYDPISQVPVYNPGDSSDSLCLRMLVLFSDLAQFLPLPHIFICFM